MTLTDSQNLVVKWWHTTRDYNTGTMLLAKYCRNKSLVHTLSLKTEQFGRKKLEYELTKAVRLSHLNMPQLPDSTIVVESPSELELSETNELPKGYDGDVSDPIIIENSAENSVENSVVKIPQPTGIKVPIISYNPTDQYPKLIRRIKHEYSELYKARGISHKNMVAVPELNTAENNKLRSGFLQQIKNAAIRMDFLYLHIKDYEDRNIIPAEETIWPEEKVDNMVEVDAPTLSKRRLILLNANYKDNNQLRFQQIKKKDKENPLPEGPKREKIKLRMQKRLEEVNQIEIQLIELQKNAD